MGEVEVLGNGPVYLDASAFIYSVERINPYRTLLEPMWHRAQSGRFTVVSSELVVSEILVRPLWEVMQSPNRYFVLLLGSNEVRLIAATRPLWEQTARLRAETGLKTPDALHAASAMQAGCTLFLTNEWRFSPSQWLASISPG